MQVVGGRLEDIFFDYDKYNIRDEYRSVLARNAEALIAHPEIALLIEGHCDERGTNEYNLALGEARAQSTKNYLVDLGISAARLGTISFGEERPLDPRATEDAWSKNRRAHFVVVP